MGDKVIKQTLLKFYDNERDKNAASVLDEQSNASEFMRQLLADYKSGKSSKSSTPPSGNNSEVEELRRELADVKSQLAAVFEIINPNRNTYHMVEEPLPSTHYQMESSPPPVQMTPPTNAPAFAGTKTNGKSDGNAANNLLASLDNF